MMEALTSLLFNFLKRLTRPLYFLGTVQYSTYCSVVAGVVVQLAIVLYHGTTSLPQKSTTMTQADERSLSFGIK